MRRVKYPLIKHKFTKEDIVNIKDVLDSGWLTKGGVAKKVEEAIKKYTGAKYSYLLNSATSGLICAIEALKLPRRSKIIVPSFTFPAVANAVVRCGYIPVFCDIDLNTFNISPDSFRRVISKNTRAVIVVHEFGLSADLDTIVKIAKDKSVAVIEDAACSLGAEYNQKKVGTFGKVGVYSFHPRKIITSGEGGCVVTNSRNLIEKIKMVSDHGQFGRKFVAAGYNFRLSDLHSALLLGQLLRIEKIISEHIRVALNYKKLMEDMEKRGDVKFPWIPGNCKHVFQSFVLLLSERIKRDRLKNFLYQRGIESQFGTYCVPLLDFYRKNFRIPFSSYRNSLFAYHHTLTLPLYAGLKLSDQMYIIENLEAGIKRCAQ